MNRQRPVHLNLFTIKFPIPAIVSILHRLSGLLLFFLIPFLLWMLQQSLASHDTFLALKNSFSYLLVKGVIGLLLMGLIYHFFAGIRHLLMDMGIGESLKAGRLSAKLVFVVSGLVMVLVGFWLC